ncbi:hypothetical protein [Luteibacter sp.]|uniref:hypothetical protein n=1 Tax=Luteibacter sp. TaxID=1886636 RepID=UPI003F80D9D6
MAKKTIATDARPVIESQQPVSKGQKSFNMLVEKIRKRRATLAEWEAYSEEFNRRYNGEYIPQRRKFDEVRTQLILRLDQSHEMKGLTKAERNIIADLISHIADQVLESTDDPVVAEIFDRYNAPDPADPATEAAIQESLRSSFKEVFAFDIPPEIDMRSPEDVMRYLQEQLDEEERAEQQRSQARAAYHAERKKAPKRSKAEERALAEEAEVHLSLREVYRKLASALHPDREADPAERERKAALMQRVNGAYAKRSLLDLLEIQLELEHIDQAALQGASEQRLKRWNKILKDQVQDLEMELFEVDAGFQMRCGMTPVGSTSPKIIKRVLNDYIRDLNEHVRWFEDDLKVFDDLKRLKPWLRTMKAQLQSLD